MSSDLEHRVSTWAQSRRDARTASASADEFARRAATAGRRRRRNRRAGAGAALVLGCGLLAVMMLRPATPGGGPREAGPEVSIACDVTVLGLRRANAGLSPDELNLPTCTSVAWTSSLDPRTN